MFQNRSHDAVSFMSLVNTETRKRNLTYEQDEKEKHQPQQDIVPLPVETNRKVGWTTDKKRDANEGY